MGAPGYVPGDGSVEPTVAVETIDEAPVSTRVRHRFEKAMRPWRRANPAARWLVIIGFVIVAAFAIMAAFSEQLAPYGEAQYCDEEIWNPDTRACVGPVDQQLPRRAEPSDKYPFGTTESRFDVLSRVIIGSKIAIAVVVFSTAFAMFIGVPLGLFSGYVGGRVDRVLVLVMDTIYAFPGLLLAIMLAFVLRTRLEDVGIEAPFVPAAISVGTVYIPQYFRVIRNHTLSVKEEPFVEAARSLGASRFTIMRRYIFLNVVSSIPVLFTLNAADAVLTLAGLGFLGYGITFPSAEWGLDISQALDDAVSGFWWTTFWPGIAITLLVTGLTLMGEGLNDIVNPLLRVKGYRGKIRATAREAMRLAGDRTDITGEVETGGNGDMTPVDLVAESAPTDVALSVADLRVAYATPNGMLHAVDGVSLEVHRGESVGLVGESGCGKSTIGRALLRLLPPGAVMTGRIELEGASVADAGVRQLRRIRGDRMALVFQEPMTRLDPLMRVSAHFVEAIRAHRPKTSKAEARGMAATALAQMGIPPTRLDNYPHEFSGGMRQRIMIALGIVLRPAVVIADEPTTALDVIVEAQILDLLDRLRRDEDLGLVLITHNLGVVAETCDRVAVMYAGRIVELGTVTDVFTSPAHPYTQALLRSVISVDTTELASIEGSPPNLVDPPSGCRFAPRCDQVTDACHTVDPALRPAGPGHTAACILVDEVPVTIGDDDA